MTTLGRSRRWNAYPLFVGVAIGSLITGLVIPLTSSDDGSQVASTVGDGDFSSPGAGVGGPGGQGSNVDASVDAGSTSGSGASGSTSREQAGGVGGGPAASDGPQTSGGQTAGRAPSGQALTATDQGVSADSITLGFALLDIGSVGQFGVGVPGVDPEQQRRAAETFLADINARGGINGRTVEGVYDTFDVIDADDHTRACRALVQDKAAFAVVAAGGYEPNGALCVTQQFGRPLVSSSNNNPDELFEDAAGLLTTIFPRGRRMMINVAAEMDRAKLVKGKKIGLVFDQRGDPTASTMNQLESSIKSLGGDVVHKSHVRGSTNGGAGEIPVEVQQMQASGAEVVFLGISTITAGQYVNQADSQLYQPTWVASDWHVLYSDTSTANMPASFDGAYNFSTTRQGEWRTKGFDTPNARIQECEAIYEDGTGQDITWGENDHALIMALCDQVRIFELGAKAAGADLTAASFGNGIQRAGKVPLTIYSGGSFGPGKTDLNDGYHTLRWKAGCRCFDPTEPFHQGRS